MNGGHLLTVRNSGAHARAGLVVMPWPYDTPVKARLLDDGTELPVQIDRLDPADPLRNELAFLLETPIPPGGTRMLRLDSRGPALARPESLRALTFPTGVKLLNERFDLWLQIDPLHGPGNWFGGAVTSVLLDRREMLDPIASEWQWTHDPEKRAMQLDRLTLATGTEERLFSKPWSIVAASSGPVRASATIASPTFESDGEPARLYRTLSVSAGSDLIHDTFFVRGAVVSANYFMHVNFGIYPESRMHPPEEADWLAIASTIGPRAAGYGFAADTRLRRFRNPPDDFPDPDSAHRAFSWELGAADAARCVHLFRASTNLDDLGDAIGRAWYDHIFRPLVATVES